MLIEAINLGQVYRYITKPWDAKEVRGVLQHAIERFHLQRENRRLAAQLARVHRLPQPARSTARSTSATSSATAPALREVLAKVEQVAPTASTVLLRGETGTGKELVAHAIHINSPREDKPFVRVNCAALAPGILESELFGHEKGAFTGAVARRPGRFELADGGTLFLDEVGDLPMEVQIKLLRVLQEREFERVGGTETIKVDVRVVSATNRDLETMIDGRRVPRGPVLPAQRLPDQPAAAARSARRPARRWSSTSSPSSRAPIGKRVRGCTAEALAKLRDYNWPGNVRELENIIERAMILAQGRPARRRATSTSAAARRVGAASAVPVPSPRVSSREPPQSAHRAVAAARRPTGTARASPSACSTSERKEIVAAVEKRAATSRARRACSASTARRSTTGCASTASSTCCRPRSRSAASARRRRAGPSRRAGDPERDPAT